MKPLHGTALALAICLCSSTGALAQKTFAVKIDSMPQGASIYLEEKAAGAQGQTPHTFKLQRGSYTFILEADGYQPFARTVEVTKNCQFTFTLVKNPSPATLAISAAGGSDVSGSSVLINGKEVGKVPVNVSLQPGRYLVEVTRPGHQTFKEWVDLSEAENRSIVVTLAPSAPTTGSLLVMSNIVGAEVAVDGKKIDTAPALAEQLAAGKHTVLVQAKGYLPAEQEVTVVEGKTTKITVELKPDAQTVAASGGTLMILADQKEVEVFVDGQARGKAPVKVDGLAEGSHLVEGRRAGFVSAEQSVPVKRGEFQTIKLSLKAAEAPRKAGAIRVTSAPPAAEVFIDGNSAGKAPLLKQQLDPGPHFVTVRLKGYADSVQTVEVRAGETVELMAKLTPAPVEEDPKASAKKPEVDETIGLSSYGGQLVAPSYFTGDISLGFPHIFEGRLTAGLFSRTHIGMDGGVEFRTYGAVSEIGLHTKFRVFRTSLFATAVWFAFGGGGGPASRNTVYANLGVVASMWFKKLVTFSGRAYFSFYTDRHCPGTRESGELGVCDGTNTDVDKTEKELRERFAGTRFLLSAILEVPLHRRFNLFGILEGAPFQGNRHAYSDPFAEIMPDSDPALYGRVGGTFKY